MGGYEAEVTNALDECARKGVRATRGLGRGFERQAGVAMSRLLGRQNRERWGPTGM